MRELALYVAVATMAFGFGCDDEDEETPSLCDTFTFNACGGDVAGTWSLAAACPPVRFVENIVLYEDVSECAGAGGTATGTMVDVSAVFEQGGTYSLTTSVNVTYNIEVSATCVAAITDSTLADYCAELEEAIDLQVITCTASTTACTCSGTEVSTGVDVGAFTTSGNELTLDSSDPDEATTVDPYCVSGGQLAVEVDEEDMTSVLVFER